MIGNTWTRFCTMTWTWNHKVRNWKAYCCTYVLFLLSVAAAFYHVSDDLSGIFLTTSSFLSMFKSLMRLILELQYPLQNSQGFCDGNCGCCSLHFTFCCFSSSSVIRLQNDLSQWNGISWACPELQCPRFWDRFQLCFSWSSYWWRGHPQSFPLGKVHHINFDAAAWFFSFLLHCLPISDDVSGW